MDIEHMKSLIHGHQLRGQPGQLFLVMSLRGPSAYYFTGQCSAMGRLGFISTKQQVS